MIGCYLPSWRKYSNGLSLLSLIILVSRKTAKLITCTLIETEVKMPIFTINTNVAQKLIKPDFLSTTTELVAAVLNKPASYVVVHINPDQMMSWGGSTEPCATAQLESIGQLGKAQNKKISAKLYEHIKNSLGIKPDRMYISYIDLKKENVGYNGTTFDDLM